MPENGFLQAPRTTVVEVRFAATYPGGEANAPEIRWALRMMRLCAAWRNTSVNRTTGITALSIKWRSTIGRGFVNEVYGLVRQEAIGDITMG